MKIRGGVRCGKSLFEWGETYSSVLDPARRLVISGGNGGFIPAPRLSGPSFRRRRIIARRNAPVVMAESATLKAGQW